MNTMHFKRMERALKTEKNSPHPTHKVGAYIHCHENTPDIKDLPASHNSWPEPLERTIGHNVKLGNASTTIHAEIAALSDIPSFTSSKNSDIYITDLPCPNCAKTIAEAGIANVFIDSHTHNTPLGLKIKPYFEQVSLLMFKKAGIGVFEMNAQEKTVSTILNSTTIEEDKSIIFTGAFKQPIEPHEEALSSLIERSNEQYNRPFAACFAMDNKGQSFLLSAQTQNALGLSDADAKHISHIQNKYEPTLQPINRLLGQCAYFGLKIIDKTLYCSQTPTSREFVNMIGTGHTELIINQQQKCRDEWGLKALEQIKSHEIIKLSALL